MNFEGVRIHFLSDVFGLLSTSPLHYFPDLDVFSRKINLVPRLLSYPPYEARERERSGAERLPKGLF